MPGPLAGIRIVDLTAMISGPLATMILADQGAEVIKVEPPAGDIVRRMGHDVGGVTSSFVSSNRGKKSVMFDLKTDLGRSLLDRLVESADVFIQNFRPGTVERMGLGEDVIRARRPDIVYVSISGFGERGPYRHKRVYDPVIQALSGLADIQTDRDSGRPMMIRTIIPDKVTALTAAQAITAALLHRARTGEGQHVRLAMLDAMVAFLWPEGLVNLTVVDRELPEPRSRLAPDLIYRTSDGYITVGAVSDSEWQGLCAALERPDWLSNPLFATPNDRTVNVVKRLEETQKVLPPAHHRRVAGAPRRTPGALRPGPQPARAGRPPAGGRERAGGAAQPPRDGAVPAGPAGRPLRGFAVRDRGARPPPRRAYAGGSREPRPRRRADRRPLLGARRRLTLRTPSPTGGGRRARGGRPGRFRGTGWAADHRGAAPARWPHRPDRKRAPRHAPGMPDRSRAGTGYRLPRYSRSRYSGLNFPLRRSSASASAVRSSGGP